MDPEDWMLAKTPDPLNHLPLYSLHKMLDLKKIYEALLYWHGRLNGSEFAEAVGRSRQHIQADVIRPYLQKSGEWDLEEERGRKRGRTLRQRPTSAPDSLVSVRSRRDGLS